MGSKNPYDEDGSNEQIEDWDEECRIIEPYYFPSFVRRAQWPNHWRWTPPLGFRRTATEQLHRNLGFQRRGLYDDIEESSFSSNFNPRHLISDDFVSSSIN